MGRSYSAAVIALSALASACTATGATHAIRPEALTIGAGDAQAANTVLQMVDPWPAGVNDTDLDVPADRAAFEPKGADAAKGVKTSDIGN